MRASYFLWGALVVAGISSVILLKYKVQALEDELTVARQQVSRDRASIRVLEAEWTYLNDPERLRRLSAEHLGFGPATAKNVATLDALPVRGAQPTATPPVPTIPLRPRPQIEAEAAPPQSLRRVFFARLQNLLFAGTAGATTFPSSRREKAGK
jgi:hypothetical protein